MSTPPGRSPQSGRDSAERIPGASAPRVARAPRAHRRRAPTGRLLIRANPAKISAPTARPPTFERLHRKEAPMAHHLGWIPDVPDQRDFVYAAPRAVTKALPKKVDLRKGCPPVYDQGQLGSCTANAIAAAIEFDQIKQKEADLFTPSRLFIYYEERLMERTVKEDAGAMIRDGIKSVAKTGAPPETDWPYVINKFTQRPPKKAYTDAPLGRAVEYRRVPQTLQQMRGCL